MAETLLNYESGLSPYYGLTEIAVKHGVFKKVSTRIELPDGRKVFEKNINDKPEDFYTDEIMQQLEVAVAKNSSMVQRSKMRKLVERRHTT